MQVLLLERADHPGYWQSVTGSWDPGESLRQTAVREVREETGLDAEGTRLPTGTCRMNLKSSKNGATAMLRA